VDAHAGRPGLAARGRRRLAGPAGVRAGRRRAARPARRPAPHRRGREAPPGAAGGAGLRRPGPPRAGRDQRPGRAARPGLGGRRRPGRGRRRGGPLQRGHVPVPAGAHRRGARRPGASGAGAPPGAGGDPLLDEVAARGRLPHRRRPLRRRPPGAPAHPGHDHPGAVPALPLRGRGDARRAAGGGVAGRPRAGVPRPLRPSGGLERAGAVPRQPARRGQDGDDRHLGLPPPDAAGPARRPAGRPDEGRLPAPGARAGRAEHPRRRGPRGGDQPARPPAGEDPQRDGRGLDAEPGHGADPPGHGPGGPDGHRPGPGRCPRTVPPAG
jgi:hypothetical protein